MFAGARLPHAPHTYMGRGRSAAAHLWTMRPKSSSVGAQNRSMSLNTRAFAPSRAESSAGKPRSTREFAVMRVPFAAYRSFTSSGGSPSCRARAASARCASLLRSRARCIPARTAARRLPAFSAFLAARSAVCLAAFSACLAARSAACLAAFSACLASLSACLAARSAATACARFAASSGSHASTAARWLSFDHPALIFSRAWCVRRVSNFARAALTRWCGTLCCFANCASLPRQSPARVAVDAMSDAYARTSMLSS